MGTHPIFESDFDCLTDFKKTVMHTAEIEIDNEVCYISVTQFGDTNFVTISDTGTFGSFTKLKRKKKWEMNPFSIFNLFLAKQKTIFRLFVDICVKIAPSKAQ